MLVESISSQVIEIALLFFISFFLQLRQECLEGIVPEDLLLRELSTALGAFMLSIDALENAVLAKGVSALGDMRFREPTHANGTVVPLQDVVNIDLYFV